MRESWVGFHLGALAHTQHVIKGQGVQSVAVTDGPDHLDAGQSGHVQSAHLAVVESGVRQLRRGCQDPFLEGVLVEFQEPERGFLGAGIGGTRHQSGRH